MKKTNDTNPMQTISDPPVGFWETTKFLGPSFILISSIVGSGEIILTTTLGATVGFVMLWWMLISCWGKIIIQDHLDGLVLTSQRKLMNCILNVAI